MKSQSERSKLSRMGPGIQYFIGNDSYLMLRMGSLLSTSQASFHMMSKKSFQDEHHHHCHQTRPSLKGIKSQAPDLKTVNLDQ